jgi:hypothetical protein
MLGDTPLACNILSRGRRVVSLSAVVSVLLGATIAYLASRFPKHQARLETLAGVLLIAGLALLGYFLEVAFGRP